MKFPSAKSYLSEYYDYMHGDSYSVIRTKTTKRYKKLEIYGSLHVIHSDK